MAGCSRRHERSPPAPPAVTVRRPPDVRRRAPAVGPPRAARQVSRSRLPLPPVPAASRPAPARARRPAHDGRALRRVPYAGAAPRRRRPDRLRVGAPSTAPPDRRRPSPVRAAPGSTPSPAARVHRPQRGGRIPLGAAPAPGTPADRSRRYARPELRRLDPALPLRRDRPGGRRQPAKGQRASAPGTSLIPERRLSGRRRQQVAPIRDSIDHDLDRRDSCPTTSAQDLGARAGPRSGQRPGHGRPRRHARRASGGRHGPPQGGEAHRLRRRRPRRARGRG